MKREFAISSDREAVQEFLTRVRSAETRGFNPKGQFSEAELRAFETTGRVIESSSLNVISAEQRKKLMTLSSEDRRRIYERHMKQLKDEKELSDYRKERESKKQLLKTGLCFTKSDEPQRTTLFL